MKQLQKKLNPSIVETILAAKKHEGWRKVAEILSGPRRKSIDFNLQEISKNAKEGENILIPGKVLSQGEIDKKIKIVAFSIESEVLSFRKKPESVKIPKRSIRVNFLSNSIPIFLKKSTSIEQQETNVEFT